MTSPRSYRMGARAEFVAETRQRILAASLALSSERMTVDITLDDVARRAGTTVQTVLRHFESRAGLLDATVEFGAGVILAERETPVGDADTAVRTIIGHYELRGDLMIRLLAQEDDPRIAAIVGRGRIEHRNWVESTFTAVGDAHDSLDSPDSPEVLDLLVVATDVFTWKLLRRDRGLDREATETRVLRLVHALLDAH
jgi:AcrR family transcriptional regulator